MARLSETLVLVVQNDASAAWSINTYTWEAKPISSPWPGRLRKLQALVPTSNGSALLFLPWTCGFVCLRYSATDQHWDEVRECLQPDDTFREVASCSLPALNFSEKLGMFSRGSATCTGRQAGTQSSWIQSSWNKVGDELWALGLEGSVVCTFRVAKDGSTSLLSPLFDASAHQPAVQGPLGLAARPGAMCVSWLSEQGLQLAVRFPDPWFYKNGWKVCTLNDITAPGKPGESSTPNGPASFDRYPHIKVEILETQQLPQGICLILLVVLETKLIRISVRQEGDGMEPSLGWKELSYSVNGSRPIIVTSYQTATEGACEFYHLSCARSPPRMYITALSMRMCTPTWAMSYKLPRHWGLDGSDLAQYMVSAEWLAAGFLLVLFSTKCGGKRPIYTLAVVDFQKRRCCFTNALPPLVDTQSRRSRRKQASIATQVSPLGSKAAVGATLWIRPGDSPLSQKICVGPGKAQSPFPIAELQVSDLLEWLTSAGDRVSESAEPEAGLQRSPGRVFERYPSVLIPALLKALNAPRPMKTILANWRLARPARAALGEIFDIQPGREAASGLLHFIL